MKGITSEWLKERGLVETSPGVYGRAMLPKALQQPMPSGSLFDGPQSSMGKAIADIDSQLSSGFKEAINRTFKKPVKHVTGYIEDHRLLSEFISNMRITDIFIPVQPMSSKNSKQIGKIGSAKNGTQKTILRKSDAALNYEKEALPYLMMNKLKFKAAIDGLPKPYYLYFTFIMGSRRRFDYVNLVQGLLDLMQAETIGMLDDDDFSNVVPVFNQDVYLSQSRPGLIIQVIKGITINY